MREIDAVCEVRRHVLSHAIDAAFALREQVEVIHETAYRATNEGADTPEVVLERIKNLSLLAVAGLNDLVIDLGVRLTNGGVA